MNYKTRAKILRKAIELKKKTDREICKTYYAYKKVKYSMTVKSLTLAFEL